MKVSVFRFDPEVDKAPYYQNYDLPISKEDRYTVMDALNYIYNQLDTSLSFFNHSACNHGICGRCSMKINGKVKLACTCLIEDDEVVIEPRNEKVIKDLVIKERS